MISSALAISAMLCSAPDLELKLDAPGTGPGSTVALDTALRRDDGAQGGQADLTSSTHDMRATRLRWWGRTLRWSTAASLVATSTLGTMAAINQPTAFGDGRCVTGSPVLGDYGCNRGLSTLHGSAGILSVTLYTANGVLKLAAPESVGKVSAQPWHRALSYVALVGIAVQPIIGLVSAFPQVIGRDRDAPTDPFPKNLRTAHVFLGYVTTAAFVSTVAMER
jgi:hypothetical protein